MRNRNTGQTLAVNPALTLTERALFPSQSQVPHFSLSTEAVEISDLERVIRQIAPVVGRGGVPVHPNVLVCRDSRHHHADGQAAASRDAYNAFLDTLALPASVKTVVYEDGHYYLCEATYDSDKNISHLAITDSLQSQKTAANYPMLLTAEQSPFNGLDPTRISFHKKLMQKAGSVDCGPLSVCNMVMSRLNLDLPDGQVNSFVPTEVIRPLFEAVRGLPGNEMYAALQSMVQSPAFLSHLKPILQEVVLDQEGVDKAQRLSEYFIQNGLEMDYLSLYVAENRDQSVEQIIGRLDQICRMHAGPTLSGASQSLFSRGAAAQPSSEVQLAPTEKELTVLMKLDEMGFSNYDQNIRVLHSIQDQPDSIDATVMKMIDQLSGPQQRR